MSGMGGVYQELMLPPAFLTISFVHTYLLSTIRR
jgi:hypothetical protein